MLLMVSSDIFKLSKDDNCRMQYLVHCVCPSPRHETQNILLLVYRDVDACYTCQFVLHRMFIPSNRISYSGYVVLPAQLAS